MQLNQPPPRAAEAIGEDQQFTQVWSGWFRKLWIVVNENQPRTGFSGTITTAALTAAGAPGSMTFSNGVLTQQVKAT